MELNSANRIKEFDKKLSSYGQHRFKFMIIPIFVLFTLCIDPMYKSEFPYHVLGVFNRGILIFINTCIYINSYIYTGRNLDSNYSIIMAEFTDGSSINKNLKYCPIGTTDIFKLRVLDLLKYTLITLIIYIFANCIFCMHYDDSYINIYTFLYTSLIVIIFGFLPGCLNIILENFKNKHFFYKKMGVLTKAVLFCVVYMIFINTLNFCTKEKINILYGLGVEVVGTENYFEETQDFKFMPKLKDLPEYKDVFYEYTKGEALIFGKKTFTFVVEYDDDIYKKEKTKLSEDYEFYDIGEHDQFLYDRGILESEFSVNSYNFKIMKSYKNKPINCYCNDLGMIGISDEKHSIAYLYYINYMHFNVEESWGNNGMAGFVKDVFKYNF